jgi:hypothetical protein
LEPAEVKRLLGAVHLPTIIEAGRTGKTRSHCTLLQRPHERAAAEGQHHRQRSDDLTRDSLGMHEHPQPTQIHLGNLARR